MQSFIEIGDMHVKRIEALIENLTSVLPITLENVTILSDEYLSYLEVILNRFCKLQDLIGAKVFPCIISFFEENSELFSIVDCLNYLAKLEFLIDMSMWVNMRKVRNIITHEYPDKPVIIVEHVTLVMEQLPALLGYWQFLKSEIEQRLLKQYMEI